MYILLFFQLRDFIFDDLKLIKVIYEIVDCFFIKFRYENEIYYLLFLLDFNCFHC